MPLQPSLQDRLEELAENTQWFELHPYYIADGKRDGWTITTHDLNNKFALDIMHIAESPTECVIAVLAQIKARNINVANGLESKPKMIRKPEPAGLPVRKKIKKRVAT